MARTPKKDTREIAAVVGPRLRAARKALGLRQEDVAKAIGCTTEWYARMERGGGLPSTPMLKDIANLLDLSVDDLLDGSIEAPSGDTFDTLPPDRRKVARRLVALGHDVIFVAGRVLDLLASREVGQVEAHHNDGDDE